MGTKWKTRRVGDVTVVDAEGRITMGDGSSTLRETIRDLAAAGNKNVVLNLAEISYVDSSGIGELVAGLGPLSKEGGALKLLNPSKRVRDLLEMTRVLTLFQVFDNEDAAVRSFAQA